MNRRKVTKSLLLSACVPFLPQRGARAAAPASLSAIGRTIEVNGKPASVYGLVGPDGKPGLSLMAEELADISLTNGLAEPTLIHWHGLAPEWQYDGVPDSPMPLLGPGETRSYKLPGGASGTHWMHAHSLQEQNLLAAPLIVRSKEDLTRDQQEIVVLLHDFSFTPAAEILDGLKKGSGMMHGGGIMNGMGMRNMGGGMMMGMDVNDINYDAYLANDRTLDDPEIHRVEKGGRVRLRIINGATATGFIIDTGALTGELIAVDGQDIVPLATRQFPLGMGQRADFGFDIPAEGGVFPVMALREGARERTGIILATPGMAVAKVTPAGAAEAPLLSLDMEARLASRRPLSAGGKERRLVVNLFGSMQGYEWGMEASGPLMVREGERLFIEMRNHSMMTHPMHLHGHHFQIVALNGRPLSGALRDTVNVPHMNSVTFAFDAKNPGGGWAFHCHHLYHMASGMMTMIGYEGA